MAEFCLTRRGGYAPGPAIDVRSLNVGNRCKAAIDEARANDNNGSNSDSQNSANSCIHHLQQPTPSLQISAPKTGHSPPRPRYHPHRPPVPGPVLQNTFTTQRLSLPERRPRHV
jgi:hypothetical protein